MPSSSSIVFFYNLGNDKTGRSIQNFRKLESQNDNVDHTFPFRHFVFSVIRRTFPFRVFVIPVIIFTFPFRIFAIRSVPRIQNNEKAKPKRKFCASRVWGLSFFAFWGCYFCPPWFCFESPVLRNTKLM